jgi:hypothetical protein
MILNEVKQSMLFKACEYQQAKVDMQRFADVNDKDKINPEKDIIAFYLGVHVLGVVEQKFGVDVELPDDVAELVTFHHNAMEEVFFRIFTYIMLISVGESRHGHIGGKQSAVENQFGEDVWQFAKGIAGKNRSGSRHAFLQEDRDLLTFAKYCDWMFIECFGGGSYGGPKWQNISKKVTQVLTGEISPFTMVDVAWALVHNTGSIFNKNTIYTSESSSAGLTQLLDMQRGGAIPALIMHHSTYKITTAYFQVDAQHSNHFVKQVEDAMKVLGDEFAEYVTPAEISKAGALSSTFDIQDSTNGEIAADNFLPNGTYYSMGVEKLVVVERK